VALPVAGRAEDLLAEEPVLLRLEGAVVDGLRLLDLTVRPVPDVVGRGQPDSQFVEEIHVEHLVYPSCRLLTQKACFVARTPAGGHTARRRTERNGLKSRRPN